MGKCKKKKKKKKVINKVVKSERSKGLKR